MERLRPSGVKIIKSFTNAVGKIGRNIKERIQTPIPDEDKPQTLEDIFGCKDWFNDEYPPPKK